MIPVGTHSDLSDLVLKDEISLFNSGFGKGRKISFDKSQLRTVKV
jgi:hypothetical protein